MTSEMPLLKLWALNGVGLIIAHPSGVHYTNQVGGYSCDHPSIEGVFIPLTEPEIDQQTRLYRYFTGPKWMGHCYSGIDDETADFVDDVLAKSGSTSFLKVDRSRLDDCEEAWIHVRFDALSDPKTYALLEGFAPGTGILTWANSD